MRNASPTLRVLPSLDQPRTDYDLLKGEMCARKGVSGVHLEPVPRCLPSSYLELPILTTSVDVDNTLNFAISKSRMQERGLILQLRNEMRAYYSYDFSTANHAYHA